jgi:hypothetical protein
MYVAVWVALLSLTILLRVVLLDMAALMRLSSMYAEGSIRDSKDSQVRFMGRDLDTGDLITQSHLTGMPATIMVVAQIANTQETQAIFLSLVRVAWRRSFGRLWILCQDTRSACEEAALSLQGQPDVRPTILYEAICESGCSPFSPRRSNMIVHLDSDGRAITYGYIKADELTSNGDV